MGGGWWCHGFGGGGSFWGLLTLSALSAARQRGPPPAFPLPPGGAPIPAPPALGPGTWGCAGCCHRHCHPPTLLSPPPRAWPPPPGWDPPPPHGHGHQPQEETTMATPPTQATAGQCHPLPRLSSPPHCHHPPGSATSDTVTPPPGCVTLLTAIFHPRPHFPPPRPCTTPPPGHPQIRGSPVGVCVCVHQPEGTWGRGGDRATTTCPDPLPVPRFPTPVPPRTACCSVPPACALLPPPGHPPERGPRHPARAGGPRHPGSPAPPLLAHDGPPPSPQQGADTHNDLPSTTPSVHSPPQPLGTGGDPRHPGLPHPRDGVTLLPP